MELIKVHLYSFYVNHEKLLVITDIGGNHKNIILANVDYFEDKINRLIITTKTAKFEIYFSDDTGNKDKLVKKLQEIFTDSD